MPANKSADAQSVLKEGLTYFYVAYQTSSGVSWRIIETPLDLDKAEDLKCWIATEERNRGMNIAPLFWKRLKTGDQHE